MSAATAIPRELVGGVWRIPVDRYHEWIRSGDLTPDDRIELLEALLVEKAPKNPAHRIDGRLTFDALVKSAGSNWHVDEQNPITLQDSEPEPDVVIVKGSTRDYRDRHPGPADVGLVVEVSETSLRHDRLVKKRIYASAGIPVYWILDVASRTLEVYREPRGSDYAQRELFSEDESVGLELAGEKMARLLVRDLLP
ncbi:MAG: Uma2 family endonuclease [Bryobacteraceae bacterium]